eukprot:TRINITY_DN1405_c1_g1_i1.p1 TRINITY_DN1405_c1_g1~~TRINITY_DN1405_c1_g1_i1.p1  ORF type:complete len:552 (+),score=118.29 TRINITY_DN1405_c1_g1_i1:770-2425(+)
MSCCFGAPAVKETDHAGRGKANGQRTADVQVSRREADADRPNASKVQAQVVADEPDSPSVIRVEDHGRRRSSDTGRTSDPRLSDTSRGKGGAGNLSTSKGGTNPLKKQSSTGREEVSGDLPVSGTSEAMPGQASPYPVTAAESPLVLQSQVSGSGRSQGGDSGSVGNSFRSGDGSSSLSKGSKKTTKPSPPSTQPAPVKESPLDAFEELEFFRNNTKLVVELKVFSYTDLKAATKGFSNDLMLGIGGFGSVYKGFVTVADEVKGKGGWQARMEQKVELIEVAIKRLDAKSLQGHREWMTEVSMLGLFDHPHLVKLIGYCAEEERRLLVYEYLANTSLDRFIFGDDLPPLDWNTRLKVAEGAGRGLAYLHEEVEPQVIYRDFKTSNVLLDEEFNPKLSDFGLAREGPDGEMTHVSTQVRGTAGYAAPEYLLTGHLTPKNDVWSFGVVLLELLTGRPCFDKSRPRKEQNLVQMSRPYLATPEKFHKLMDPRLGGAFPPRATQKAAELAKWCLSEDPNSRPLMSEVVALLAFLQTLREPGKPGGGEWGVPAPAE